MTLTVPILVGVILGFNQLLKNAGVPTKVIPLVSMLLGIGAGFFFLPGANIQETVFNGIAIGLGSNGLFDFAKSTVTSKPIVAVVTPPTPIVEVKPETKPEVKIEVINKPIGFN